MAAEAGRPNGRARKTSQIPHVPQVKLLRLGRRLRLRHQPPRSWQLLNGGDQRGVSKGGAATGLEKSEKRGVQAARNGPSEDRKCWQHVELGIHGLRSWGRNWLLAAAKS